jgi:putative endonuclease
MVFAEEFEKITDAIAAERQLKGWSRAKKVALINRDYGRLPELARRRNRSKAAQNGTEKNEEEYRC